jgi:hypothetical protein
MIGKECHRNSQPVEAKNPSLCVPIKIGILFLNLPLKVGGIRGVIYITPLAALILRGGVWAFI